MRVVDPVLRPTSEERTRVVGDVCRIVQIRHGELAGVADLGAACVVRRVAAEEPETGVAVSKSNLSETV